VRDACRVGGRAEKRVSWDRNNTILVNLLRAIPEGALEVSAMQASPTIAQLFTHIQIKLARLAIRNEEAGPITWRVWMRKK
jgi:hypothetical protein